MIHVNALEAVERKKNKGKGKGKGKALHAGRWLGRRGKGRGKGHGKGRGSRGSENSAARSVRRRLSFGQEEPLEPADVPQSVEHVQVGEAVEVPSGTPDQVVEVPSDVPDVAAHGEPGEAPSDVPPAVEAAEDPAHDDDLPAPPAVGLAEEPDGAVPGEDAHLGDDRAANPRGPTVNRNPADLASIVPPCCTIHLNCALVRFCFSKFVVYCTWNIRLTI